MKRTSAEKAAELTGQPLEIYLDDERVNERIAAVREVQSIEYPIDLEEVRRTMEITRRDLYIITDGTNTHLFRRTAEGVAEISSVLPYDKSGRSQIDRVLRVYRRNRREDARDTDVLKGLLLFSKGLVPDSKEEAEDALDRLGSEAGVQISGFDDWPPVHFAIRTLQDRHAEATPGEMAMAFLNTRSRPIFEILGSERVGRIAASFVKDETSTFQFFNPYIAAELPYGSIEGATCPNGETFTLVALLMGVRKIWRETDLHDPSNTLVCSTAIGLNNNTSASILSDALDALPDGGRLIAVEVPAILYGMRTEAFRTKVRKSCTLSAVIRVIRGFTPASSCDALILVIDKLESASPTEYAVVPDSSDLSGDWRTWEGVTFTESLADYGTDWMMGFRDQCFTEMREGPKLRDVAEIRKGSIVRSEDLFPSDAGTGIPFLKVRDVSSHRLDLESAKRASGNVTVVAKPGDILLPCNGMIDRVYRLRTYDPVVAPSYSLAIITANKSKVLPEFLEIFFKTKDFAEQAEALMTGNMTRTLSKESLSRIIVPDIMLDEQIDIVDRYRDLLDIGEDPDPDEIIFGEEDDARGGIHRQDRGGPCGAAEDGAVPGGAGGREGRDQSSRDRGDLLVLGPFEGCVRSGRFGDVEGLRVPSLRGREQEDGAGHGAEDTERRGADAAR